MHEKRAEGCIAIVVFCVIVYCAGLGSEGMEACEVCECIHSLRIVNCMGRGLTVLPTGIPNDTKVLNLGENDLQMIPYDALLDLKSLIVLNVTSNRISSPFEVPESLRLLFANGNKLEDIKPMVKNGINLEAVNFPNNNLRVIETDTFKRCQKLTSLHLSSNHIMELQPRSLAGPPNIDSIRLGGNELEEIPTGLFTDPSLQRSDLEIDILDLASNRIRFVASGAFQGVKTFRSVQLFSNNLVGLPGDMFAASTRIDQLQLSSNRLVSGGLPEELFVNTSIYGLLDLSSNQLTTIPSRLFRSQSELKHLYLYRNQISTLNREAFQGMTALVELMMFDNPVTYLPNWVFYETNLMNLYMFQTNLSSVGSRSFATAGNTLTQISLYDSKLEEISDSVWQDLGTDCYTAIDNSLKFAPRINRTDLNIELVGEGFAQPIDVPKDVAKQLAKSGFNCQLKGHTWQCTPCPRGHYGTKWFTDPDGNRCIACPAGGFYQNKTGQVVVGTQSMNCQTCNNGTFVTPAAHPGISPADCTVCPTGTNKSLHAGFRACPCVDNYYRRDRFGECYQCPVAGINCSGEYQHLLPGFWWTWDWGSSDTFQSYKDFVRNVRTHSDSYHHGTESFLESFPRAHSCPRKESCLNAGDGINATCDNGYEGWLCSECSKAYYSWFDRCFQCPTLWFFLLEVVGVILLIVLVIALIAWDLHRNRESGRSATSLFLARGKIMLGFYQVMGEIFSDLDEIPWPDSLKDVGSFVKLLEVNIMQLIISPRCYFPDFTYPNIYIEFIAGLGFVMGVVLLAWCFYIVAACYLLVKKTPVVRRREVLSSTRQNCYLFVVILLFVSYPGLSSVVFTLLPSGCNLFYLDENDAFNVTRLRSDYSINCETQQHVHFIHAAEASLCYVVGFPLVLLLLLLWGKRRKQNTEAWHLGCGSRWDASFESGFERGDEHSPLHLSGQVPRYRSINATNGQSVDDNSSVVWEPDDPPLTATGEQGRNKISWKSFLCENYKPQFWYWEIVELARKIVQTLFVLLYGPDDHFTMFATIAISVGFLLIHAYVKPMKNAAEHRLQMFSLGAIFLNLLTASMLLLPSDEHSQSREKRISALAVFLVLLNLSIVVFVAASLVWSGVKTLWQLGCCGRVLAGLRRFHQRPRGATVHSEQYSTQENASLLPAIQTPYAELIGERGRGLDTQ
ncbi:uncharacterized protein LOC119720914 [Patiria miniata]|uniref:Uncharacterized protein n=1 Tax=Patiria miniata TaxID=46514 RepID=A0A913Z4L3_PATMI|nr:uncharacterized protein LOC119720914 [Patiria miniata]